MHAFVSAFAFAVAAALATPAALAQPLEPVLAQVRAQKQPMLDTLKELTAIESGSRDIEGLDRIAAIIEARLKALGADRVEILEPANIYRMEDTPEKLGNAVRATFKGKGTKKLLLIAHMDTVYAKGQGVQQPFRIDGDKAYGLGIADDRHGIAMILHAIKVLRDVGFDEYGTLTVLISGDEEISSPGHRDVITKEGAEHDATMSFESAGTTIDQVRLATAGIAGVTIKVKGRASHAGSAPERGINALYELAHQILQMKDFSDPATGLKMNWTVAKSGFNRNVIPFEAEAMADIRVLRVADFDGIEAKIREKAKTQLVPDAKVEVVFDRRRPPLEAPPPSIAFARHAQEIYKELGKSLNVATVSTGGGTDAAFAALKTKAPVVEGWGLMGFGAHSNDAEYIYIDSIEPRLYLATRMIMDFSRGKVAAQ
jgi:glutamate carboxypeptidase